MIVTSAILLLTSCETDRSETIISRNSDNSASIKVYGYKTPLDPWQTILVVEGFGQKDSASTEIYADELNSSVVNIAWNSENQATVSFTQTDNTNRVLNVEISPALLRISE